MRGPPLTKVSYERFCYALAIAGRDHADTKVAIEAVFDALDAEANSQLLPLLAADDPIPVGA